jgi:hypothetical protein
MLVTWISWSHPISGGLPNEPRKLLLSILPAHEHRLPLPLYMALSIWNPFHPLLNGQIQRQGSERNRALCPVYHQEPWEICAPEINLNSLTIVGFKKLKRSEY